MKKLLILLIAAGGTVSTFAQSPTVKKYTKDADLGRWVIDVNLMGGMASQDFKMAPSTNNYPNALNMNTGELKFKNGYSYGGDVQVGFFFGKKRHFGLGAGLMYMQEQGDAVLDKYHVEYQSKDGAGNTFRQVVTGNDIRENISSSMFNVPVVLKYKNRFSKHWGFTADAGALINLQMKNSYTTHASFDHEAIYKLVNNGDGGTTSVYDNSPTPDVNDWMITKAEFLKNNPSGNLQDYFNAKRAIGYNVGTGLEPGTKKGKTSYTTASIGLLLQPSFNYFLSDQAALNIGGYYMFQPFKSEAQSGYKLTDGAGNYSSVLNNVTASNNQAYGVNLGVRFFLGSKHTPLSITRMEQSSPTQCSACDGGIVLYGLTPNALVSVDYSHDGGKTTQYATTVQPDGQVKINNLCAGSYTGIVATIKKQKATGTPVTIADPLMRISGQTPVNPTAPGTCNGSVQINGLYAGKAVTINYDLNGTHQTSFTGVVNSDNSVTINGLCEGRYSGIVAKTGSCVANGNDFTLAAPTPPAPQPIPVETKEVIDITTPILFDVNKTIIHSSSMPVIEEAANEMKEHKNASLVIDGHADASGVRAKNDVLSLKRAIAVKTELTKRGISPARMKTRGHGSNSPAATNSTYEGKKENRRATMKLIP
jgi:outer membrane protein OmpA-like peptidoglycan-associated protein